MSFINTGTSMFKSSLAMLVLYNDLTGIIIVGSDSAVIAVEKTEDATAGLHKMKEIYSNDQDAKIAFTCFNKIMI